eukprot:TRINITY_DN40929_c0_g1_i1.p1 TRINITY_DN40929_c0_g1~~TRINITY_DN40929_c0_g1_i1.p1  ORF type:complete len:613 (-),score=75.08 TRINITY_DN40929_c0_g1_i1:104-1942(-)
MLHLRWVTAASAILEWDDAEVGASVEYGDDCARSRSSARPLRRRPRVWRASSTIGGACFDGSRILLVAVIVATAISATAAFQTHTKVVSTPHAAAQTVDGRPARFDVRTVALNSQPPQQLQPFLPGSRPRKWPTLAVRQQRGDLLSLNSVHKLQRAPEFVPLASSATARVLTPTFETSSRETQAFTNYPGVETLQQDHGQHSGSLAKVVYESPQEAPSAGVRVGAARGGATSVNDRGKTATSPLWRRSDIVVAQATAAPLSLQKPVRVSDEATRPPHMMLPQKPIHLASPPLRSVEMDGGIGRAAVPLSSPPASTVSVNESPIIIQDGRGTGSENRVVAIMPMPQDLLHPLFLGQSQVMQIPMQPVKSMETHEQSERPVSLVASNTSQLAPTLVLATASHNVSTADPTREEHRRQLERNLKKQRDNAVNPKEFEPSVFLVGTTIGLTSLSGALWLVLVTLTALYWQGRTMVVQLGTKHPLPGQWTFHLAHFFQDKRLCVFSCCCGPVRWAHTVRTAGLLGYWTAFSLFTIFSLMASVGVGIGSIPLIVMTVYYRQEIKAMFSIESYTCWSVTMDILVYTFCSVCAIIQEAREMELAAAVKHPALPTVDGDQD